MKKSELKQLILLTYQEVILLAKEDELVLDLSILDLMFDDPNIRYTNADCTLVCIAKHPKFGDMPVYLLTIKMDRYLERAGLLKFVTTTGSGLKFKAKKFDSALLLISNAKELCKNIRMKRDGISIKDLATKLNK